jgi:hypothetical protein
MIRTGLAVGLLVLLGARLAAGTEPAAPGISAADAFAKMKTLVGEWTGKAGEGQGDADARVVYRLTGAGSALVETLFPGLPHEMITVYHLDGDRLMMTHYCAAGNQPRMTLTQTSTPQSLVFAFSGATNLKSDKDMHMHDLSIRFVDPDHIQGEWVSYQDGRKAGTTTFNMTRVK